MPSALEDEGQQRHLVAGKMAMVFCLAHVEINSYYTVRQACVHVLNLRNLDMLFALCPFYFCLTKNRNAEECIG